MKTQSGIRLKNGMDEIISTTGVITDSGKFVVAAQGRFNGAMAWKPTAKNNGTDSRIVMRLDVSVSHYDSEKNIQGDFVIPYVSARVLQIKGTFGSRTIVGTPFDNESNKQYKNALISDDMWGAIKESIKVAITDATDRAKTGKAAPMAANSEYIDNADEFLSVAESIASKNVASIKTVQVASDAITNAAEVEQILGIQS